MYGKKERTWSQENGKWASLIGKTGTTLFVSNFNRGDINLNDERLEPDAGIINFYQLKVHAVHCVTAGTNEAIGYAYGSRGPFRAVFYISAGIHIVRVDACVFPLPDSLSRLGQAAVFLIGGLTRDEKAIPIVLRSGDVLIMSGPRCRRAFHGKVADALGGVLAKMLTGVPRILERSLPIHLKGDAEDNEDWTLISEYLETTRININVRQVFPPDFDYSKHNLGHLLNVK